MNNNMFVSIRTDIGSDFKVRMLCKKFGMEALAWWVLTIVELYQEDGYLMLDDDLAMEVVAEKFAATPEQVDGFFGKCAEIGLIDSTKWATKKAVFSESLYKELEYKKSRSEVGKMGGKASGKSRG